MAKKPQPTFPFTANVPVKGDYQIVVNEYEAFVVVSLENAKTYDAILSRSYQKVIGEEKFDHLGFAHKMLKLFMKTFAKEILLITGATKEEYTEVKKTVSAKREYKAIRFGITVDGAQLEQSGLYHEFDLSNNFSLTVYVLQEEHHLHLSFAENNGELLVKNDSVNADGNFGEIAVGYVQNFIQMIKQHYILNPSVVAALDQVALDIKPEQLVK